MLPLDPLSSHSPIFRLLKRAAASDVRAELDRLSSLPPLNPLEEASLRFAHGVLGLREGELDQAHTALNEAFGAFDRLGEKQAALMCRCEALMATIRRGPRSVYSGAVNELDAIEKGAGDDIRLKVVAMHYAATATRMSGDAVGTEKRLLRALAASEHVPDERAKVLNSMGTLYVVMGVYGAAESLLSHAAELHHQFGDAVGEAIAYGQLGAAAIGMGDLERARLCLQKQEWLCSRVGDAYGRARALTFLADVALDLGRPDDALTYAEMARGVASSTTPPLRIWIAYATRAAGRGASDLGKHNALSELLSARELFSAIGNPLGSALCEWDLARHHERSKKTIALDKDPNKLESNAMDSHAQGSWFKAAWSLASLGLSARVAQLLSDQRGILEGGRGEQAGLDLNPQHRARERSIAALCQLTPHLSAAHEVELIYGAPDELSAIASRRTHAQRNLARLAALCIAERGLWAASIHVPEKGHSLRIFPGERASAALIACVPGGEKCGTCVVWAWPMSTSVAEVGRDLASLRGSFGSEAKAFVFAAPSAQVLSPPFAGELKPEIEELDLDHAIAALPKIEAGTFMLDASLAWHSDLDAPLMEVGFSVRRRW